MSDDPTSDALSRASAYLDGELDAPEAAAVEADAEVMAEVARLRALQHEIRDVPAPSPYGRDMAVAAALAEYDTLHPTAATVPVPAVPAARRPNYGRWMAVAAAVAGVAALGAVITTAGRGGNEDRDSAAASAEESAVALDDATAERSSAGGAPAAPQPEAQSQTMLASEAAEAPAATTLTAGDAAQATGAEPPDNVAAASTAAPASSLAAPEATSMAGFDPTTPIPDEVALGRIGRQLLSEWKAGQRVTKTGTACDAAIPDVVLLSDAVVTIDGADRAVLIAGNPEDETISALDPASCVVIVTGR